MAGVDPGGDGGFAVIVLLPLFPVQSGGTEHPVDHLRVCACTKCDHGAQCTISLGLGAVAGDVAVGVQFSELLAVLLLHQAADEIEQFFVAAVALFAVPFLLLAAHILIQRHEQRVGAILQRHVPDHVARVNGKAIGKSAAVQLGVVVRILRVVGLVQP